MRDGPMKYAVKSSATSTLNLEVPYMKARVFDTSTIDGLKAAERYKTALENKYDKVITMPIGLNRVQIAVAR
jgi:hypothetical protein